MLGISRKNWCEYHNRCLKARIKTLRNMTNKTAFELYEEFFELAATQKIPDELEKIHWDEKFALRKKNLTVFHDIDRRQCGKDSTENNPRPG